MSELRWGHVRADDVGAWAELTNLLARVDETDEFYDAEDLAEELEEEGVDPELDTWAIRAGDLLVGFGQLRVGGAPQADGRVRCQLGGGVHPDHRGRGIGRELMDRMETRAAALAAARHPGLPAYLRTSGGLDTDPVRPMLRHRGYDVLRYFNQMRRDLPGSALSVDLPAGMRFVSPVEEHREAVRLTHNAAFADHWGSSPSTPGRWSDLWSARSRRPAVSCLILDEAGEVVSYVISAQWVDRELYVDMVGTRPDARGRGLARAALAQVIALASASGDYDLVELDVDSASPTGATRLYDSLGFEVTKVMAAFGRDL